MCVIILSVSACSQVLLEAQEMAVKDHNVEYKSNLYVGECATLVSQWRYIPSELSWRLKKDKSF